MAFVDKKKGVRIVDVNRYPEVRKRVKTFGSFRIDIGVLDGEAKPYSKGQSDPASIGQVAAFNEFGTASIPSRSYIRSTFDEKRDNYAELLADMYEKVERGDESPRKALGLVGQRMSDDIKDKITELRKPPNAPSTIEAKGSDNPLVDTGQLRQSIAFNVSKSGLGE